MGEGGVVKDEDVRQAGEKQVDDQAEYPDANWAHQQETGQARTRREQVPTM